MAKMPRSCGFTWNSKIDQLRRGQKKKYSQDVDHHTNEIGQ